MKLNPWYTAALLPLFVVLAGQGEYAAQLAVLGLTLGIFFGTLSLRRPVDGDAAHTNPGT
jgi:hypothetical protein